MKGKQLLLLLLLVGVIGGGAWYLQKGNQESWSGGAKGAGAKVLEFPINDVSHVQLKSSGSEANLVKKDEQWTVQERAGYPASFEQVSGLLRKLWDLKTVQEVKVGPSQMPRMELTEPGKGDPSGTLVDLKDKDGKSVGGVLLGKKHMRKSEGGGPMGDMGDMGGFPTGRYVLPVGGQKVSLVSETLDEVEPKPERWLKKDFVKIENPKKITLAGAAEGMNWSISRESATAEWKLADANAAAPAADAKPEGAAAATPPDAKPPEGGEPTPPAAEGPKPGELDTSKVSQFATLLSNPVFKDVLNPDAKPEDTGLDKPTTATFETFDGLTYALKIGKLMSDAYPVQFTVTGDLPKERTPGQDEKPEDKTRLDEAFAATQKKLQEKLETEKKLEGRTYLLEKFTVEPLLKERSALLVEAKPATPPASPDGDAPVSATTPPVSIPPNAPAPPQPAPAPPTPPPAAPSSDSPSSPPPAPAPAPASPRAPPTPESETPPASASPPPPAPVPPSPPAPPAAERGTAPTQPPPPAAPVPPSPPTPPNSGAGNPAPSTPTPSPPEPASPPPAPPKPAEIPPAAPASPSSQIPPPAPDAPPPAPPQPDSNASSSAVPDPAGKEQESE